MKYVYRNPVIWSAIVSGVVLMIVGKVLDMLTPRLSAFHLLADLPFQGGAIMAGLFGLFVVSNFLGSRFTAPWECTEWLPSRLVLVAAFIAVLTLVVVMFLSSTAGFKTIFLVLSIGTGLTLLAVASAFFIAGLRPPPIRWED